MAARLVLAILWLLHWLPLGLQALLGRAVGALLWQVARSRRRVALRNLELCFPQWPQEERRRIAREHFGWVGRSLLERGLLWYASPRRLARLIHIEGDIDLANRSDRPVMWLVPHFLALDVAGVATQLRTKKVVVSIYSQQSNPVFDAAMRRGRTRLGLAQIFPRSDTARPLMRAIKAGQPFFNLPDMDFGERDSAFVPFFAMQAATLRAPSRMARSLDMVVQPVLAEILPGGAGYRVNFMAPWADYPTDDPVADAARMNRWIEEEIRRNPTQYLWVHKRFKTRPPGEPPVY